MLVLSSRKLPAIFLLFIIFFAELPYASGSLLKKQYSINITDCRGSVNRQFIGINQAGLIYCWYAVHWIYFDNGLHACRKTWCRTELEAIEKSQQSYSGDVNIILDQDGKFIFEQKYKKFPISLYLNSSHAFPKLPRIISITENLETNSYWWLFNLYRYRYVIELDDGSMWITKEQSSSWTNAWEVGSQIIIIGNCQHVCFINKNSVEQNENRAIEEKDYINEIESIY